MDQHFLYLNTSSLFDFDEIYEVCFTNSSSRCIHSLGQLDVSVGVLPVEEQVRLLVIVDADVLVVEHSREEVVDLFGHVQDVADPAVFND